MSFIVYVTEVFTGLSPCTLQKCLRVPFTEECKQNEIEIVHIHHSYNDSILKISLSVRVIHFPLGTSSHTRCLVTHASRIIDCDLNGFEHSTLYRSMPQE